MIETCYNCLNYKATLVSPENDGYHIHNWCSVWKAQIPSNIVFNRMGLDSGYDDIECGYTKCHAFLSKPRNKCYPDEMFMNFRKYNEGLKV